MAIGRVIRFDEIKGYGFIAPNDGSEDVFVHANEITDRGLRVFAGTKVEFRAVGGDRGLKAFDVRILDEPGPGPAPSVMAAESAPVSDGRLAGQTAQEPQDADEDLCEVFPEREFMQQITDLLLAAGPQLTGATILELRSHLLQFARKNGWVE